ncbi:CLC_0170 family protein [Neobacillus jeddahensis]|uniref:CLC_0170 family protein n=1 Tax=Neobacillus jeddahensis TaxID=1461580 RepID=UPI00058C1F24|nr:CLC_0170 family protein [Neobacillus jeddahensis]
MYIGYLGYVITIFCSAGLLLLISDVKGYRNAHMKKEQKVSQVLGWMNIVIGLSLLVVNWFYQTFF